LNATPTPPASRHPGIDFGIGYAAGLVAERLISRLLLPWPLQWLSLAADRYQAAAAAGFALLGAALVWGASAHARRHVAHRRAVRAVATATLALLLSFSLVQAGALTYLYRATSGSEYQGPYWYLVPAHGLGWLVPIGVAVWLYRLAEGNERRTFAAGASAAGDAAPDALRIFFGNLLIAFGVLMLLVAGACAVVLGAIDDSLLPTVAVVSGGTALVAALPIALGRWLRRGSNALEPSGRARD
jgi:hypothetical protein